MKSLLVVVSLNQEKEEIIRQLQYWNSFVDNCCSSAGRPLRVAVFSHADEVTEEKPERKSSEIVKGLAHSETSSSFSEAVTLDCRKLASGGLTKISKIVAGCCAKFRQSFRFDFAVQLLYAFISSRLVDRIACTVSELQSLIKQEQGEDLLALKIRRREILPTNTTELSQYLTTLSDKGQFLFLMNARKVEDSRVVIDKAVLLSMAQSLHVITSNSTTRLQTAQGLSYFQRLEKHSQSETETWWCPSCNIWSSARKSQKMKSTWSVKNTWNVAVVLWKDSSSSPLLWVRRGPVEPVRPLSHPLTGVGGLFSAANPISVWLPSSYMCCSFDWLSPLL